MAVYAYLRVSTGKQDGENQRLGVDELAKRLGLEITEYIDDEGVSGTKEPEKRELGKLLKKLKPGDVLLAGEISRLGRSLFMVMRILEYCMNNDIRVYTAKDGYELGDNIQSKVLAFAFGLSAEIEREMISRLTKEALAKKRAEGVILGRPKGRKSGQVKLSGKAHDIKVLLDYGIPKMQIAKKMKVNRNTLATYLKERYEDELLELKKEK
ncbi:MAG: recombinase family protein [Kiritimatiellae bacterium]|nr:recombinase family protein [Kiritimatiellia bacterium]